MLRRSVRNRWMRLFMAGVGSLICAISLNVFIMPQSLYGGGMTGISQLIRNALVYQFHIDLPGVDLVGVLYFLMNIVALAATAKTLGKNFVGRTIICTAMQSLFYSIVPIPDTPVVEDPLTSCLLGGILTGIGVGIVLTCGYSGGGNDLFGLYLSKKGTGITVGKFNMMFNLGFYLLLLFIFDPEIVIYSAIFNFFTSMVVDKMHQQNITSQVLIVSKNEDSNLSKFITENLVRGVTYWQGHGGYTDEPVWVYCVCLSKYEIEDLRQAVHRIDPHAFFIIQEGVMVDGNFAHRVTEG